MRRIIVVAVGGLLALPGQAMGQTCDSDDDSDDFFDDDDDFFDDSSVDDCLGCGDSDSALAGALAKSRLRFSIGASSHAFSLRGMDSSAVADHEQGSRSYHVVGESSDRTGRAAGASVDLRVVGHLRRWLYLGGEAAFGGVGVRGLTVMAEPDQTIETSSAGYLAAGVVSGLAGRAGDFVVRGEMFFGARAIALSATSTFGDCVTETSVFHGDTMVQSRLALERWISPRLSIGAMVGSDPFRRGDLSMGLFVVGHTQPYDRTPK